MSRVIAKFAMSKPIYFIMRKHFILPIMIMATVAGCTGARVEGEKTNDSSIVASQSSAVVDTDRGKIAGYIKDGTYIYRGVPYAKAERFMPPVEADRWDGVRSCRHYGPTAPQAVRQGYSNDEIAFAFDWDDGYAGEDCQRLNIWTPGINDGKKRRVMVWLHGGGYSAGSGQELPSYDGAHLSQKGDVVVVTLNHRLNVLGFLDLSAFGDKYADSGNAGMLDIISALKWIKTNISNIGGDPDNVTIFGQSGGGGKVTTLTASPMAEGLFHKAIVQSGSVRGAMTRENSQKIGMAVLEELNISPAHIDEISTVPYDKLLAAGERAIERVKKEYEKENGTVNMMFGWSPVVDGRMLTEQPYMNGAPACSKNVPMIIGTTLNEFAPSVYVPQMRNLPMEKVMEMVRSQYGDLTDKYVAAFEQTYPGYKPNDLIDTDYIFRPTAVKQADLKAQSGGAPVWMYIFAWQSPILDGSLRATHCMEIPFVFNNADVHASMTGGTPEAMTLADKMSGAWINFARTGNPGTDWPAYTAEDGATMWWDNTPEIKHNHDRELLKVVEMVPQRRP